MEQWDAPRSSSIIPVMESKQTGLFAKHSWNEKFIQMPGTGLSDLSQTVFSSTSGVQEILV